MFASNQFMERLNLPTYSFKIKKDGDVFLIFDEFRRKWVRLTPEEWVRQHFACFLTNYKGFPKNLTAIEYQLKVNGLIRRADIVCFNKNRLPVLLVECKAASVKINQQTFNQVMAYNYRFKLDYLVVTNGMQHFCCRLNRTANQFEFMNDIPAFKLLV